MPIVATNLVFVLCAKSLIISLIMQEKFAICTAVNIRKSFALTRPLARAKCKAARRPHAPSMVAVDEGSPRLIAPLQPP